MVKTITPFSTRAKEGATDSPLGDFVNVDQSIVSTADVGFYDSNTGKLTGVRASDKLFGQIQLDEGIANGATIITPSVNADGTWPLDMTGYNSIFLAINPSNGGNYAISAVMGPDAISFGGLSPLDPASLLQGNLYSKQEFQNLLRDTSHALTVDVWNLMYIQDTLQNQKVLMFSIVNNSGGSSDIQTAFMRVV